MTGKITVVATAGTCEIVLTELGFYVRCNDCSYVSEAPIHAKFRARMAGDAHKCAAKRQREQTERLARAAREYRAGRVNAGSERAAARYRPWEELPEETRETWRGTVRVILAGLAGPGPGVPIGEISDTVRAARAGAYERGACTCDAGGSAGCPVHDPVDYPPTCILTGQPGEDSEDCTTHDHERA